LDHGKEPQPSAPGVCQDERVQAMRDPGYQRMITDGTSFDCHTIIP